MLSIETVDKKKLNLSGEMLILNNQQQFETDSKCFHNLENNFNIIKENSIFECKGRLENAPFPIETKLPILI